MRHAGVLYGPFLVPDTKYTYFFKFRESPEGQSGMQHVECLCVATLRGRPVNSIATAMYRRFSRYTHRRRFSAIQSIQDKLSFVW